MNEQYTDILEKLRYIQKNLNAAFEIFKKAWSGIKKAIDNTRIRVGFIISNTDMKKRRKYLKRVNNRQKLYEKRIRKYGKY